MTKFEELQVHLMQNQKNLCMECMAGTDMLCDGSYLDVDKEASLMYGKDIIRMYLCDKYKKLRKASIVNFNIKTSGIPKKYFNNADLNVTSMSIENDDLLLANGYVLNGLYKMTQTESREEIVVDFLVRAVISGVPTKLLYFPIMHEKEPSWDTALAKYSGGEIKLLYIMSYDAVGNPDEWKLKVIHEIIKQRSRQDCVTILGTITPLNQMAPRVGIEHSFKEWALTKGQFLTYKKLKNKS